MARPAARGTRSTARPVTAYLQTPTERLADVKARIAAAAKAAGRDAASVRLVAITKTFGAGAIVPVLEAGHRIFGENRVQEARAKWPALRERYAGIELHLVGALQSNKAQGGGGAVRCHPQHRPGQDRRGGRRGDGKAGQAPCSSSSRSTRARSRRRPASRQARRPPCCATAARTSASTSPASCASRPLEEEPGVHFAFLAKLAGELGLKGLSMGMSADFETAIAFGATHVRVGSEIFGPQ